MPKQYTPLPSSHLSNHSRYHTPRQTMPDHLNEDMPAIYAMTDLQKVAAVTIEQTTSLETANQKMIANQVRLLLVCRPDNTIAGILTATDILGEKPVRYMHQVDCTYDEIMVHDVMTPHDQLDVLNFNDVQMSYVGDIVATLTRDGRQHALVIDRDRYGMQRVRGIFSASQISRQLGVSIPESGRAHSFAELEKALMTG